MKQNMETSAINFRPSVQELSFIIAPPPHILSDVAVLKDDVQYLIGHDFEDRFSKAHIPLFRYADENHVDMINYVMSKARTFKPFNVFIKNLNALGNGSQRTIYLDIINKYPLRDIFEKLIREDANFIPRISIARNLPVNDFLKAWPYLKDLPYSQHFLCDRITVLSRTDKQWKHYGEILLGEE